MADASLAGGSAPIATRPRRSRTRSLVPFNPLGLLTGLVLVGLWQLVVDTRVLHYEYLPAPSAIIGSTGQLVSDTHFGSNLAHTVIVTLIGWAIASVGGVALGAAVGLSRVVWRWTMASIDILRALPIIAFVPVAVLIFGLSSTMELSLVIYAAFWPVVINTIAGVRAVSPVLRDVASTLKLTRLQALRKVVMPSAAGSILVGMRLALALALVLAVVAEMVGNPTGLGYQLVFEQNALKPDLMFGYVVVVGLIGLALNAVLIGATRLLLPGLARNPRNSL